MHIEEESTVLKLCLYALPVFKISVVTCFQRSKVGPIKNKRNSLLSLKNDQSRYVSTLNDHACFQMKVYSDILSSKISDTNRTFVFQCGKIFKRKKSG